MSPLEASSGRVMVAGVVRRLRALVSCSITASMSYSDTKQNPTEHVVFLNTSVVL